MLDRTRLVIVVALVAAPLGCDVLGGNQREKDRSPPPGPPPETAEQALKRMQREECAKLTSKPDTVLETSDLQYVDEGIINDYRQLTGVTVLNKARYCAVKTAEGDVTWFDANGGRFGSTAFTLRRSIPAGATQRFSTADGTLTSRTIQGAAVKAQITFTHVDVIEPP